jgi:uncharacterized protein
MHETALITGAAGGLGREFCRIFAERGFDLVIIGRRRAELETIAKETEGTARNKVTIIEADLNDPAAPQSIADQVSKAGITVTALVNNAGFGCYGPFAETELKMEQQLMQVDMVALTVLTKLLLPPMVAAKHGRVLNVASTAAFQPGPLMAVYYASKAYVLSFSVAIAEELKGTGVTVTCLCPGPTKTGFVTHANMAASRLFRSRKIMDPNVVARAGVDACLRGKAIITPGFTNAFLAFATRFAPRPFAAYMAHRAQRT